MRAVVCGAGPGGKGMSRLLACGWRSSSSAAAAACAAVSVPRRACGMSITLTPPATAAADSAARMPPCAMCRATSELLQAVSVLTHGPCGEQEGRQAGRVAAGEGRLAAGTTASDAAAACIKGTGGRAPHLEAKGVGGAADQEGEAVPHNGVGVGVRHARRRQHAVQVLCERARAGETRSRGSGTAGSGNGRAAAAAAVGGGSGKAGCVIPLQPPRSDSHRCTCSPHRRRSRSEQPRLLRLRLGRPAAPACAPAACAPGGPGTQPHCREGG